MSDLYEFGRQVREFLAGFMGLEQQDARPRAAAEPEPDEVQYPDTVPDTDTAPGADDVVRPDNPTGDSDFIAIADKKAGIQLLDPTSDEPTEVIHLKGTFGKGCLQMSDRMMHSTPIPDWDRSAPELSKPLHGINMRNLQGELYSEKTNGPVLVQLNPLYKSYGREESISPEGEFPKVQEFRQYALFTMEVKVGDSGESVRMMVGNKLDNPIRARATLNKPFGEELPLKYDLVEERVPLWEWDNEAMMFAATNSVTGETSKPVAYIMQELDELVLQKAWKREFDPEHQVAKYVEFGPSNAAK